MTCAFIRSPRDLQGDIEWLILDGDACVASSFDSDESIPRLTPDDLVVLMLPGSQILHISARVPSRQQKKIRQAAPYMIEDQLAQDVEELHFAFGQQRDDLVPLCVIDRKGLAACIEWLEELCILPHYAVSESSCLREGELLIDGAEFHMNALNCRLSGELDLLPAVLTGCVQDQQKQTRSEGPTLVLHCPEDQRASLLPLIDQVRVATGIELKPRKLDTRPFETLCRGADLDRSINLLQGEFARVRTGRTLPEAFRPVFILAGVAMLFLVLAFVGQGLVFSMAGDRLDAEARLIYRDSFPDMQIPIPGDLRRLWAAELRNETSRNRSDFFDLLLLVGNQLDGTSLQLDGIDFNSQRAESILQLRARTSDDLVNFTEALSGQGFQVEVDSIDQEETDVRGSVRVSRDQRR